MPAQILPFFDSAAQNQHAVDSYMQQENQKKQNAIQDQLLQLHQAQFQADQAMVPFKLQQQHLENLQKEQTIRIAQSGEKRAVMAAAADEGKYSQASTSQFQQNDFGANPAALYQGVQKQQVAAANDSQQKANLAFAAELLRGSADTAPGTQARKTWAATMSNGKPEIYDQLANMENSKDSNLGILEQAGVPEWVASYKQAVEDGKLPLGQGDSLEGTQSMRDAAVAKQHALLQSALEVIARRKSAQLLPRVPAKKDLKVGLTYILPTGEKEGQPGSLGVWDGTHFLDPKQYERDNPRDTSGKRPLDSGIPRLNP